jgi:ribosomal protein S18 acetylase RimI-like enzyme
MRSFFVAIAQRIAEVCLPKVRRARRDDATQLAVIAEKTFRDTFAGVNSPEDMDLHCRTRYSEAIQAKEIADRDRVTLLCEDGGRLVGFAQLRLGKALSCVVADAAGEIQRLYVISEFQGKGIAHDLMNACMDEMTGHRSDVVWRGGWERNPKASAFYRKFGAREVCAHIFPLGNDPQRDVVMARPVVDSAMDVG